MMSPLIFFEARSYVEAEKTKCGEKPGVHCGRFEIPVDEG
jgi:hypothetical protein